MPAGAPKQFNIDDIIEKLNIYIDETEEPFIQEFCLNYNISRVHFYELSKSSSELSNTIKKCLLKQELYIVKNASKNKINPAFSMFRLKQPCFGYTDKQEVVSQNENTNVNYDMASVVQTLGADAVKQLLDSGKKVSEIIELAKKEKK